MTKELERMTEAALSKAESALSLGQENSKTIAVLAERVEGNEETQAVQNEATHKKLDRIEASNTEIKNWIKGAIGSALGALFALVWYLLTHPGVGLTQ